MKESTAPAALVNVTPDLSIVKGGVSLSSGLKQALSSRQMMKESGSHFMG
jgi:hypothetical protein